MSRPAMNYIILSSLLLASLEIIVVESSTRGFVPNPTLEELFYKGAIEADKNVNIPDALIKENRQLKKTLIAKNAELSTTQSKLKASEACCQQKSSELDKIKKRNINVTARLREIEDDWHAFCKKKNLHSEQVLGTVEKYRRDKNLTHNNTVIMASACISNNVDVVAALLDMAIECETPIDDDKETCLHVSARTASLDLMRFLFSRECNIEAKDRDGWTPLISATFHGQIKAVQELVEQGVDIEVRSSSNFTALRWAKNLKNVELVDYLQSKGAKE